MKVRRVVADAFKIAHTAEMVLRASESVYDPVTMQETSTTNDYRILGAEQDYDARYMSGANVETGDSFVTIAAEGLPIEPRPGMNLFMGPDTLTSPYGEVKGVQRYRLQGVMLGWTLHVRGIS